MTTASTQPTRREILKWFSGIPFLPLERWLRQQH